jgi:hypothetical protein
MTAEDQSKIGIILGSCFAGLVLGLCFVAAMYYWPKNERGATYA